MEMTKVSGKISLMQFHMPQAKALNNRRFMLAVVLVTALVLVAVVIFGIAFADEAAQANFAEKDKAPSPEHIFGTDWMGRDMLLRTLAGLSTSVLIGALAACISTIIALVLGSAAALGGRKVDVCISWLIDLMLGVPHIILIILISFALGKGALGVLVGVALTHWPSLARVIRAEMLQCKQSEYVHVAAKLGVGEVRIAFRHMLPFVLPQLIIGFVLMFPHAILHEAAITFLGFGLPPEQPAIGMILSESMRYLTSGAWWLAVFPGIILVAVVMLFDCMGANLRKLLDPRTSQE